MAASLTKAARCRQGIFALATLLHGAAAAADAAQAAVPPSLRDCVAAAKDATALAGCERQEQLLLTDRIAELSDAIRARLDARERRVFERNSEAWQAFVDSEIAMLELSFGRRGDGLGAALRPGAITLIYEARENQLRQHLHNLGPGRSRAPGS